jgi:hypothetical protein
VRYDGHRIVCTWCDCVMIPGEADTQVSSGICPACLESHERDELQRWWDNSKNATEDPWRKDRFRSAHTDSPQTCSPPFQMEQHYYSAPSTKTEEDLPPSDQ